MQVRCFDRKIGKRLQFFSFMSFCNIAKIPVAPRISAYIFSSASTSSNNCSFFRIVRQLLRITSAETKSADNAPLLRSAVPEWMRGCSPQTRLSARCLQIGFREVAVILCVFLTAQRNALAFCIVPFACFLFDHAACLEHLDLTFCLIFNRTDSTRERVDVFSSRSVCRIHCFRLSSPKR